MIVLVSGDRRLKFEYHFDNMRTILDAAHERWAHEMPDHKPFLPFIVIQGEAMGADKLSEHWVKVRGRQADSDFSKPLMEAYPANWAELGKRAGPVRNQQMLDRAISLFNTEGHHIELQAFPTPESVGTRHMIRICEAAGVKTEVHDQYVPKMKPRKPRASIR